MMHQHKCRVWHHKRLWQHRTVCADALVDSAGQLGWAEVQQWMWPLWDEKWSLWRKYRLHLLSVPLDHYRLADASARNPQLPPAVPLLYGVSPSLVPVPSFWPDSIHMCGFWQQKQDDVVGCGTLLSDVTESQPYTDDCIYCLHA